MPGISRTFRFVSGPFSMAAVWIVAIWFAIAASAISTRAAEPPRVEFDVAYLVACRDMTPPDFAEIHPHEKLVEAVFSISALLRETGDADLAQFFYEIQSPHKSLRVVDHLPRMELATPIVGPVSVDHSDVRAATAGAGAGLAVPYGTLLKADASISHSRKTDLNLRYQFLPPKELLAASGTLHRERGVYFKLKPSPQTSLEGARQFVCVFRVPQSWRGDFVQVRCEAAGRKGSTVPYFDATPRLGGGQFLVGLYLEGDQAAQLAVQDLAASEERLLELILQHRGELDRKLRENQVPPYVYWKTWISPQSPSELQHVLLARHRGHSLNRTWPAEVCRSVTNLADAMDSVRGLSR